ncbi:Vegetative incompatibility protein HET-E-1 [Fusarium oxysporum f. sp. cubense]|uniref:Vegetative incompatibility protein HET-E-1 n=1 Tax=Fusarium oxysporum f. sp. cubense TaxID=61366 RepID=A0A559L9X3_FUSOC|nr:Vegetative incompatibility protein HET-E-1 [Fusarium oxysporum f. sp. cubense]
MEMVSITLNLNSLPQEYPYAILSHTWGEDEVSFQDYHGSKRESMKGFAKVKACCMQARKDSIGWVWIDTCCIDKKDSAELSEAINSMYAWYRESAVCYALLEDVHSGSSRSSEVEFRSARWFTRGWCLQELIAPRRVEFYAGDWSELGTKWSLATTVKEITGIPYDALCHNRPLSDFTAAERMSWASKRETTRIEDMAYCLLGIFDVNMPLIYGEGKKSFIRLQMEILKEKEDYSLFLHKTYLRHPYGHHIQERGNALASSPVEFDQLSFTTLSGESYDYESLRALNSSQLPLLTEMAQGMMARTPPYLTSQGLRIQLLTLRAHQYPALNHNSILVWTEFTYHDQLVCVRFTRSRRDPLTTYMRNDSYGVQLVEIEKLRSFYLKRLQLEAGQIDIHSGTPRTDVNLLRWKAVELALSSTCKSTFNLIQSLPPMEISGKSHDGTSERLYFHDFEPENTPASQNLDSSVLRLHLRLYRDTVGNGPFRDLIVTVLIHPEYPRCLIEPDLLGQELNNSDENQTTSHTQHVYSQASDFAALQLPNWCHVTCLVKVRRRSIIALNSTSKPDLVIVSMNVCGDEG